MMRLALQACTRQSARHQANQDRATVGEDVLSVTAAPELRRLGPPALVAVLDGVGGAPAGDLAADLAARTIAAAEPPATEQHLVELLERADQLVLDAGRVEPLHAGMATTAGLLLLLDDEGAALVANVGDSRIARLESGGLVGLSTSDRVGHATIHQALGGPPGQTVTPHVAAVQLAVGDRLLLATDGLTDVVDPDTVARMLSEDHPDPARRLLETVERAGVPDDVTIVVVDVEAD
jgi:PPM family protein phosphatase